jgi:acetyltransferase-like isoleucine patch superfamily enzyme
VLRDNCVLSFDTWIMTGQRRMGSGGHERNTHVYESVEIEEGVWIGAGEVVLLGIQTGRRSISAANAFPIDGVPVRVV